MDAILAGDTGSVQPIGWIRGNIIPDPSLAHGFRLDPATTYFGDGGLIPEVVTTIDRVEADPAFYQTGPYAPYAFDLWVRKISINP